MSLHRWGHVSIPLPSKDKVTENDCQHYSATNVISYGGNGRDIHPILNPNENKFSYGQSEHDIHLIEKKNSLDEDHYSTTNQNKGIGDNGKWLKKKDFLKLKKMNKLSNNVKSEKSNISTSFKSSNTLGVTSVNGRLTSIVQSKIDFESPPYSTLIPHHSLSHDNPSIDDSNHNITNTIHNSHLNKSEKLSDLPEWKTLAYNTTDSFVPPAREQMAGTYIQQVAIPSTLADIVCHPPSSMPNSELDFPKNSLSRVNAMLIYGGRQSPYHVLDDTWMYLTDLHRWIRFWVILGNTIFLTKRVSENTGEKEYVLVCDLKVEPVNYCLDSHSLSPSLSGQTNNSTENTSLLTLINTHVNFHINDSLSDHASSFIPGRYRHTMVDIGSSVFVHGGITSSSSSSSHHTCTFPDNSCEDVLQSESDQSSEFLDNGMLRILGDYFLLHMSSLPYSIEHYPYIHPTSLTKNSSPQPQPRYAHAASLLLSRSLSSTTLNSHHIETSTRIPSVISSDILLHPCVVIHGGLLSIFNCDHQYDTKVHVFNLITRQWHFHSHPHSLSFLDSSNLSQSECSIHYSHSLINTSLPPSFSHLLASAQSSTITLPLSISGLPSHNTLLLVGGSSPHTRLYSSILALTLHPPSHIHSLSTYTVHPLSPHSSPDAVKTTQLKSNRPQTTISYHHTPLSSSSLTSASLSLLLMIQTQAVPLKIIQHSDPQHHTNSTEIVLLLTGGGGLCFSFGTYYSPSTLLFIHLTHLAGNLTAGYYTPSRLSQSESNITDAKADGKWIQLTRNNRITDINNIPFKHASIQQITEKCDEKSISSISNQVFPHSCSVCDQKFVSKNQLFKHIKQWH